MGKFEGEELKRVMYEKAKLQSQAAELNERVNRLAAKNRDLEDELFALRDCNNRRKANEEKYSELFELLYSIRQCQKLIDPKAAFDEIMGLYGNITES